MMMTAAHLIFYAVLTLSFVLNFVHYMHMFQLNSYDPEEQVHWIKKNLGSIALRHLFPLLAAGYALIFCVINPDTGYGCILKFCPSASDLLICAGLILAGLIFCRHKHAKKSWSLRRA